MLMGQSISIWNLKAKNISSLEIFKEINFLIEDIFYSLTGGSSSIERSLRYVQHIGFASFILIKQI